MLPIGISVCSDDEGRDFCHRQALSSPSVRTRGWSTVDLPPYQPQQHPRTRLQGRKPITTPFDMTVLHDLNRFHLVMDIIDRLPQTDDKGIYLKKQLKEKLIEHKQYITTHSQVMPEIRNWKW
jgi:phosphoketolase